MTSFFFCLWLYMEIDVRGNFICSLTFSISIWELYHCDSFSLLEPKTNILQSYEWIRKFNKYFKVNLIY